jgi:UDP:flavonoid glycosyltransferase YjiC (YdhE family)
MICLVPHCGYLSETSRMIEIWRALRARGTEPRVATHGGTYEHLLQAAGIVYDLIDPPMTPERCTTFVRSGVGMGPPAQSMYTDDELRTSARAEAAYFRRHGVTVAVTGFTLTTLLSTQLAGVKLVTEHAGSFVPPLFERGLLPLPVEAMPPKLRYLPRPLATRLFNLGLPRLGHYCSGFVRVAAELGVPAVTRLPALLLGDLTLVPEIPEVLGVPAAEIERWEPAPGSPYRPGSRMRCTGPLYARLDLPVPEPVERFLSRPGPVAYVAITSSSTALVRAVVQALANVDVRVLVAGTVHEHAALAEGSDPEGRVLVGGVLPSHLIMPRVALAVTAGGQGSVQTAMAAGTPLLGIALQPEQDLNIVLAERQGAARRIAPRHAGTSRLTALATSMLADARYRQAAQRIAAQYARTDGPGNAAEAILELAGRPATRNA